MANNVIKRIWNQNKMVNIEALQGMAFQAEDGGHTFEISGVDDSGNPVALSGTVAGVFVRPDNADIALSGTASDGKVYVTLSDACYAVPGKFGLTIFVTADSKKTAVYAAIGTVTRTSGGAVAGDTPQDVVDLINAISTAVATIPASYTALMAAVAPAYSNSAVYAVGTYAWYNGSLYRCTTDITTAESWTSGHWTAVSISESVNDDIDAIEKRMTDTFVGEGIFGLVDAFGLGTYSGYLTNTGAVAANSDYQYSELVPTKPGDVWLYQGKQTSGGLSAVWGYKTKDLNNPTPVSSAGAVNGFLILTVPAGVYYIRAFGLTPANTSTPTHLIHGENVFFYDAGQGSIRTFFNTYILNPSKSNKYKVYVLPGTYSFDTEFTSAELSSSTFRGVYVPAWTTLEAYYTGSVTFACTLSSNSISTLNLNTSSALVGINVTGENCRYAIHDDWSNAIENERYLKDCTIVSNGCSYGYAYGAGCAAGQKFVFDNCVFKGETYEDGGFLIHSNTGFSFKTVVKFNDCTFISLNGHPERACNIRGLGSTSIVNDAYFNNCNMDGLYLQKNTVFDWHIMGSGNSVCPTAGDNGCETDFADKPYTDTTYGTNYFNALPVGSFRFANNIPQWWNGTAWVNASGTAV